ncbi:hypothetical protein B0H14DRAFT_2933931 [Mycena olivaceomarginata]|nr:hypothetical protein B0H14DRAFT_2933931 [Mycena olivaceomarginata]
MRRSSLISSDIFFLENNSPVTRDVPPIALGPSLRLGLGCFRFDRSVLCRLGALDMIDGGGMVRGGNGAAFHSASCIALGVALVIVPLILFSLCELSALVLRACSGCRRRSMPKDTSRDEVLPFPGEYGPDRFTTQYINLGPLTNAVLTEHCKSFKLPHSGNKAALTQRLTAFSKDKEHWTSILPGATNAHKGSRKPEADKKTKPKISTLRREGLILHTAEEKAAIMPWAKRIVEKYPYKPCTDQADVNASIYISRTAGSTMQPRNESTLDPTPSPNESIFDPTPSPSPQNKTVADILTDLLALVQNNGINTSQSSSDVQMTSVEPLVSSSTPLPPPFPSAMPPPPESESTPVSSDITGHSDDDENAPTRTLKLAGGKFITFTETEVPDPPAKSYANCIQDLLSEWDNNIPHWKGNSPLEINGVPVALVYWPIVYRYWKGSQWRGVKKIWFDWKVLFHAMSATTLDEFWTRYSVHDKSRTLQRMKYTPLFKQLATERMAENERLANELMYRKGGKHYKMTKPAMIAAHYRKLKGLDAGEMDADDDEE